MVLVYYSAIRTGHGEGSKGPVAVGRVKEHKAQLEEWERGCKDDAALGGCT